MPNHVMNIVEFEGKPERIRELMLAVKPDEDEEVGKIDFRKLIPMPESLDIESGSITGIAIEVVLRQLRGIETCGLRNAEITGLINDREFIQRLQHCRESKDELIEKGLQYISNKARYGHTTWYSWCIEHWGTKWNAYENAGDDDCLVFQTAWSAPHPIIEKLAEMFPDVGISHEWADEDIGCNCGTRDFANGELVYENYPDGYEATAFACSLWGWDPDNFKEAE